MKVQNKVLGGLALAGLSSLSFAASPYAAVTSAVDWTTVGAAIIAIAALKAAPLVVSVGSKMVLRMIGR